MESASATPHKVIFKVGSLVHNIGFLVCLSGKTQRSLILSHTGLVYSDATTLFGLSSIPNIKCMTGQRMIFNEPYGACFVTWKLEDFYPITAGSWTVRSSRLLSVH